MSVVYYIISLTITDSSSMIFLSSISIFQYIIFVENIFYAGYYPYLLIYQLRFLLLLQAIEQYNNWYNCASNWKYVLYILYTACIPITPFSGQTHFLFVYAMAQFEDLRIRDFMRIFGVLTTLRNDHWLDFVIVALHSDFFQR